MRSTEIQEAAAIVLRVVDQLLATARPAGREGSNLRRACGDVIANVLSLVADGSIAVPLRDCYELARLAGATLSEFDAIRLGLLAEQPRSLLAVLTVQCNVLYCLQQQAMVISVTTFTSRQDVDAVQAAMNVAFNDAEEVAADQMESSTYQALTALHGALTFYLYDTARPLPRVLAFQFAQPRPSLVFAYRLYDDARRADELRAENKVVHPAFMRPAGLALSA